MVGNLDWHWVFLLPFGAAIGMWFAHRDWKFFSALCLVAACLITLVVGEKYHAPESHDEILGISIAVSILGFLFPSIMSAISAFLNQAHVGGWLLFALAVYVALVSPVVQQLLAGTLVLVIMCYGIWLMLGRPRLR